MADRTIPERPALRKATDADWCPPVDASEAAGDLVDGAMQVVDAALKRHGEVDDVLRPAAEQDVLRRASAPEEDQRPGRDRRRRDGDHGGAESEPTCDPGGHQVAGWWLACLVIRECANCRPTIRERE